MQESSAERQNGFKALIDEFLKKEFVIDDQDVDKLARLFLEFVEKAKREASKMMVATHVKKAIHPCISKEVQSLYCPKLPYNEFVGSHLLSPDFAVDIDHGNAANMKTSKFLCLKYQGKPLAHWLREKDVDLMAVLGLEIVLKSQGKPASHTLAKQVYWLIGNDPVLDEQFHLLSPFYASSLAHMVYMSIQRDRFGDDVKQIREAKKNNQWHDRELREYPDLAVQKLGGTQPQNISQLNSERHGESYLLSSLPPLWKSKPVRPIYGIESVFVIFGRLKSPANLVKLLRRLLESDPKSNIETRSRREDLEEQIIDEFILYTDSLHTLEPGWSRDERCRLPQVEKLWLDVDAEEDSGSEEIPVYGQMAERFANWLVGNLNKQLPLGYVEHSYWANKIKRRFEESGYGQ